MGGGPDRRRGTDAVPPVVEVAPHTYQVGAKDLQELLDQGARLVAEAWGGGWLPVPTLSGEPQAIESPVADGMLGPRGFRLTSPKLAEAAGLETGDLILAVDGQAVNTFADLYQVYQQVRRAARRPRFEVTLERDGVQVTKTYLMR
jgi:membrane-associated protease RseP (regulator of RpoE activity)